MSSCTIIINPQEYISRFATTNTTDDEGQIKHLFLPEFGTKFTALDAPLSVLVMYLFVANSFLLYLLHEVEVVVDYEALKVAQDEKIIKRCAVASNGITPAYRFRIPYAMADNTVYGKITSRMTII
jgi:hypothetical protein